MTRVRRCTQSVTIWSRWTYSRQLAGLRVDCDNDLLYCLTFDLFILQDCSTGSHWDRSSKNVSTTISKFFGSRKFSLKIILDKKFAIFKIFVYLFPFATMLRFRIFLILRKKNYFNEIPLNFSFLL